MANRYWVGGTASWDGTAGTKWALTSGGAGGQAVPTSADDVFFDAASGANTVTIATGNTGAKSITCTGFTGTLAGTAGITVSGNVTLVAGMTLSHTGTWTLNATGTLTTAGKTLNKATVNGSGITVTLGDALTLTNALTVTQGTFTTSASNYSVSCALLDMSGTLTRSILLNASTITISSANPIVLTSLTGLTINAGTSQINCTDVSASSGLSCGGVTLYNVAFTGTPTSSTVVAISGAITFNNLSFTAPVAASYLVSFDSNQTINGTISVSGSSGINRVRFISNTLGTARTLTLNASTLSDCDFRDITIAGVASPIGGTRLGNCGGNTGITFPAAKTVYWNPASSAAWGSANWATSSGSTTLSSDNFPLAQDTAVIDQNSRAGVSNSSIAWAVGTLDMSARTSALSFGASFQVYGNYLMGTGVTGSAQHTFIGRATQTITSNGATSPADIVVNSLSTVQLADALNTGSNFLNVTVGTFDAVSYNVTCFSFSMADTTSMGSGTWTLTGTGTVWSRTAGTLTRGTANIVLSNTSTSARTFEGGGRTYNKLTIGGATGVSTLTFTGSNTFTEIASTKTVAHTIKFTAGTTTTVGAWTITGASGNVVTLGSTTTSAFTLTKTGGGTVSADYLAISYSTATPSSTWYAGLNSTDGGNNSGWIFSAPSLSSGNFLAMFR